VIGISGKNFPGSHPKNLFYYIGDDVIFLTFSVGQLCFYVKKVSCILSTSSPKKFKFEFIVEKENYVHDAAQTEKILRGGFGNKSPFLNLYSNKTI